MLIQLTACIHYLYWDLFSPEYPTVVLFVCVHDNRWDKIGVKKMMREDEFRMEIPDLL